MRISDWSSDVCSSDLPGAAGRWPAVAPPQSPRLPHVIEQLGRKRDDAYSWMKFIPASGERNRTNLPPRSEEHTSALQSLMRTSYAVFCLKKKKNNHSHNSRHNIHTQSPNLSYK